MASRKILRRLSTGMLGLAVAAGMSACGSTSAADTNVTSGSTPADQSSSQPGDATTETIKVTVWHTFSSIHADAFEGLIDDFNKSQDNVIVEPLAQPFTDFDSKVRQAVRNGTGPDVIVNYPQQATPYINAGLLTELTPLIADPDIGIPDYDEQVEQARREGSAQWDGKQYVFPIHSAGPVLFYNADLFDELGLTTPATWTELAEAGRKITAHTGKPAFGFDDMSDAVNTLAAQAGASFVNEDGTEATFNNDIYKEKITWIKNLIDEGTFRLVGEDQYFSNPFGSGAVASYIGSSAGYPFVEQAVGDAFTVGVAPIPQEGTTPYAPEWGGDFLIFKSDEARERAAFQFIKWFTSPEPLSTWDMAEGAVPAWKGARELPEFQKFAEENLAIKALIDQIPHAYQRNAASGVGAAESDFSIAVEAALTGQESVDDALRDAETAANAELGG